MEWQMNCEDYQQLVSKLLDNSLEKGKTADVFRHLGECDECRAFFGTSMHLRHAMQSAPPMQATESVDREVLGFTHSQPRVVSRVAGIRSSSTRMDRKASSVERSGIREQIRVFALVLITVIVSGLIWTRTLPKQREEGVDLTREALQSEMTIHQR
jgi:hypothetical protein